MVGFPKFGCINIVITDFWVIVIVIVTIVLTKNYW